MLKTITIKNFKTHLNTTIKLNALSLIIGSNNSGKSNLLSGIHFFSTLIASANPNRARSRKLYVSTIRDNRHRLSDNSTPIIFACTWKREVNINYRLELYLSESLRPYCREYFTLVDKDHSFDISHGVRRSSSMMALRAKIENGEYTFEQKFYASVFFKNLAFIHYYSFQPAFLKGNAMPIRYVDENSIASAPIEDYAKEFEMTGQRPNIPTEIGKYGQNFQELIKYVKLHEQEIYGRFAGYLKRFIKSFNEIIIQNQSPFWQFDFGGANFPFFSPSHISDGLLKAGVIALLCSLESPPSIIMIEEVENGINQRNLKEFLSWLTENSVNGSKIQFILTSHSPSVIREFSNDLNSVYNVYLRSRDYCSLVTSLNEALKPLARMGTIEELKTIEKNGEEVLVISPSQITELFYNGVLGEL